MKFVFISSLIVLSVCLVPAQTSAYFGVETLQLSTPSVVPRRTEQVPIRRKSLSTAQRRSGPTTSAQKILDAPRRIIQAVSKEEDPCADLRGIPHAKCVYEAAQKEALAVKRERRISVNRRELTNTPSSSVTRSYRASERKKIRAAEHLRLEHLESEQ